MLTHVHNFPIRYCRLIVLLNTQQGDDFDHTIRILLLGDSGVGKTSLMTRFSEDKFAPTMISTAGVDFKVRCAPQPGLFTLPPRPPESCPEGCFSRARRAHRKGRQRGGARFRIRGCFSAAALMSRGVCLRWGQRFTNGGASMTTFPDPNQQKTKKKTPINIYPSPSSTSYICTYFTHILPLFGRKLSSHTPRCVHGH